VATTLLTVWNQALSALGQTERVDSPTENGIAAQQCNIWYETVRDAIFKAAPWPELKAYFRLATLAVRDEDETWVAADPIPGYARAFTLPSDCIRPRYLSDYAKFELGLISGQRALMANGESPILCYTARVEDPSKWDVDLLAAVSFGLAAHISKAVTGNDSALNNMFTLANEKILSARVNNANMESLGQVSESIPDWLGARGTNLTMPTSRYIYPVADFTVLGSSNLG